MSGAPRAAGGIHKKVLWTNSAPGSGFSAQSLVIPGLSDYKELFCEYEANSNDGYVYGTVKISKEFDLAQSYSSYGTVRCRKGNYDQSTDTIRFLNGGRYSGSSWVSQNTCCVPTTIYGLR